MKDLNKYHELILNEGSVKDANLLMFMNDHVERLKNNLALFSNKCYCNQTEATLMEFNKLFNKQLVVSQEKVDKTRHVNQIMTDFRAVVNKTEALIRLISGFDSDEYAMLFPNGLTEMNNLTKKSIQTILARFDGFFTAYKDLYGTTVRIKFKKIKKDYCAARTQQLKLLDLHQLIVNKKRKIKIELIKNFQRNIYYAYVKNFETPGLISKLFKQSLLTRKVINEFSLNGNGGTKLENWQVH